MLTKLRSRFRGRALKGDGSLEISFSSLSRGLPRVSSSSRFLEHCSRGDMHAYVCTSTNSAHQSQQAGQIGFF